MVKLSDRSMCFLSLLYGLFLEKPALPSSRRLRPLIKICCVAVGCMREAPLPQSCLRKDTPKEVYH